MKEHLQEAIGNGEVQATPLVRFGFIGGFSLAAICLIFSLVYIFTYSLQTTASFEKNVDVFLGAQDFNHLSVVLLARTAQNKTLLQSCGVVAGIAFGFLGFSLFLLGIEGVSQADGQFAGYKFTLKQIAPGSLVILMAAVLIGVSVVHTIELDLPLVLANHEINERVMDTATPAFGKKLNNDMP